MSDWPAARLAEGFARFRAGLDAAEAAVRSMTAFSDPQQAARGYEHLGRMILKSIESELLSDPDHPRFRILDDRIREGGDNPDQRYAFAKIRGATPYRIHGRLGSMARLEVQLYSEEPFGGRDVGVGYLAHEDIDFGTDGEFSIVVAPDAAGRNALPNPPEATIVQVRQIYDEWTAADPGAVWIDRLDLLGDRRTVDDAETVARRWESVGEYVARSTECWPALVQRGITTPMEPNTLPGLISPGDRAGVVGRWISVGHFDLDDDEALLVEVPATAATYRGAQLSDLWFASLEYADATGSLSGAQCRVDVDGTTWLVVAGRDPGWVNWLDTGGLRRGTLHLRYDGAPGPIPREAWPTARVVPIDELPAAIPGFHDGLIGPAERNRQRQARRDHVRVRYGH